MSVRVIRDIVYREVAGQQLHLDLHLPEDQPIRGAVVYFHGGGFQVGERTDFEAERASILAAAGFAVATVQYRFVSVALSPAQVDDARAAVTWVREHAAEYGFAGAKIGSWGASAGGYIAQALALGVPSEGIAADVDAAVVWFAGADFRAMTPSSWLEKEIFDGAEVVSFFGKPFDAANPDHVRANLIQQVSADAAPTLLMTGDRDLVIPAVHSQLMHDQLVLAGAESSLLILGGIGHEDVAFHSPMVAGAIAGFFSTHLAQ